MANPTWPATLPPPIADTTAAYAGAENIIRTSMEAGTAKQRRRFTAVAEPFTHTLKLTQAQYATLLAFWSTTLLDVLPFDWTDFRTGLAATYRPIGNRPSGTYVPGSVGRWLVTVQLEQLP